MKGTNVDPQEFDRLRKFTDNKTLVCGMAATILAASGTLFPAPQKQIEFAVTEAWRIVHEWERRERPMPRRVRKSKSDDHQ